MKTKRIVAWLTAAAMVFTMGACGPTKGTPDSGKGSTASAGTESAGTGTQTPGESEKNVKQDPFFKYDEPVTITTFFEISPTLDNFKESDLEDTYFFQQMKEETNISLDYQWYASKTTDDSVQKKSLAIASGEIPDFMLVNSSQLGMLAKTDLINRDLRDIFNAYASDELIEWTTCEGDSALDSATYNGDMIAIPLVSGAINQTPMLWIRRDWVNKLGLQMPKTMDELYDLMVAFKNEDPDGNGQDDTVGLTLHKDFLSPGMGDAVGIFNGFGAYPGAWIEDGNGGLIYGSTTAEAKNALTYLSKMYKDGLISVDFSSTDGTKASEEVIGGKSGIFYGKCFCGGWPLTYSATNDPTADWVALPITSETGAAARPQTALSIDDYVVISAECEHPEAIIRMLNYYIEKFNADEEEYNKCLVSYDGTTTTFPLQYIMLKNYYALQNLNAHYECVEAVKKGDPSSLRAEYRNYYDAIIKYREGDIAAGYMGEKIFGDDMASYTVIDYYYKNDLDMIDAFYGEPTETMSQKLALITDAVMEYYTKVIMGIESLDNYDEFVAECNALGLDQITEEVNTWYVDR